MTASLFSGGTIDHLLHAYGYVAVGGAVALESLGVPLPGETMLVAAALYAASTGRLAIWAVVVVAATAAVAGDNAGFAIGRYGGSPLLRRYGRVIHVDEGRLTLGRWLFRRHGGAVVFVGRWVSILRTYAAFLAGTNRMGWPRFLVFNAAGGVLWACAYGFGTWAFGRELKRLRTPVDLGLGAAVLLVVLVSLVVVKRQERQLTARARRELEQEDG